MEDERMEQNRQPEKTDVVFFSPEMLRLADQHRREQQERLENCRQAAQNGDCAAAVQMGLHYFYGTGGLLGGVFNQSVFIDFKCQKILSDR